MKEPTCKDLSIFSDDRGIFVPVIETDSDLLIQGAKKIKRVYYVFNHQKGTIRGFHYHNIEWKYFTILNGAAKFVALNPKKPDKKYTFVSSSRHTKIISIPPGYANGWISLEDNTILLCASSSTTKESLKDDIRYNPHKWGDVWNITAR